MDLITKEFGGIRSTFKENEVYLNLEDVAKGLGFEQTRIKDKIEYKSIRWSTVREYMGYFPPQLEEVNKLNGSSKIDRNTLIPESMFYLLAMKADSKIAKEFQVKVATEILPQIRKEGHYISDKINQEQFEALERKVNLAQLAGRSLWGQLEDSKKKLVSVNEKEVDYRKFQNILNKERSENKHLNNVICGLHKQLHELRTKDKEER